MDVTGTHNIFSVYGRYPQEDGKVSRMLLGRFVTYKNRIMVLEDHWGGELEKMLPNGPINELVQRRIDSLTRSYYTQVVNEADVATGKHIDLLPERDFGPEDQSGPKISNIPGLAQEQGAESPAAQVIENPELAKPASVFDYFRAGMTQPQVVEIHDGKVLMNGHELGPQEVQRILYNVKNGLATLKYRRQ